MNSKYISIWNSPCLLQSFHLSWIITTRRSPWPFQISAMFAWLPAFQIIQNTSKALTHHQHLLGPHTGVVKQKQLPKKYCYLTNVSRKKASKHVAWRVVSYGFCPCIWSKCSITAMTLSNSEHPARWLEWWFSCMSGDGLSFAFSCIFHMRTRVDNCAVTSRAPGRVLGNWTWCFGIQKIKNEHIHTTSFESLQLVLDFSGCHIFGAGLLVVLQPKSKMIKASESTTIIHYLTISLFLATINFVFFFAVLVIITLFIANYFHNHPHHTPHQHPLHQRQHEDPSTSIHHFPPFIWVGLMLSHDCDWTYIFQKKKHSRHLLCVTNPTLKSGWDKPQAIADAHLSVARSPGYCCLPFLVVPLQRKPSRALDTGKTPGGGGWGLLVLSRHGG